jgi:hypothetical protein
VISTWQESEFGHPLGKKLQPLLYVPDILLTPVKMEFSTEFAKGRHLRHFQMRYAGCRDPRRSHDRRRCLADQTRHP